MNRYTKRSEHGIAYIERFPQLKGLTFIERLATYEDLEEREMIVRLPCPIGTTINQYGDNRYAATIEAIGYLMKSNEESEWLTLKDFESEFEKELATNDKIYSCPRCGNQSNDYCKCTRCGYRFGCE